MCRFPHWPRPACQAWRPPHPALRRGARLTRRCAVSTACAATRRAATAGVLGKTRRRIARKHDQGRDQQTAGFAPCSLFNSHCRHITPLATAVDNGVNRFVRTLLAPIVSDPSRPDQNSSVRIRNHSHTLLCTTQSYASSISELYLTTM